MNRLFYPAVFHSADEGGFWISFPDFPECLTQGETMENAYEMAVDALGLCITDLEKAKLPLPEPTNLKNIKIDTASTLLIIEFNMDVYHKKHSSKAVKKTLSIPEWLNEEAIALGVNFSQVLQEGLLQKISQCKIDSHSQLS